MTYIIRNSEGNLIATLPDGQVDRVSSSLTLIGRNVNSYGEFYNQNLINLLDNFATIGIEPRSPLVGQLWYNRQDDRLYVFSVTNEFRPVGVSQISPSEPLSPNPGDIWIDNVNKQLYISSDGVDFTLVGPPLASTSTVVRNGWFETKVLTTSSTTASVVALYNNNKVIAIASSSTFAFSPPLDGISIAETGIQLNETIPNIRFIGTAINADFVNTLTNNYVRLSPPSSQTISKSLNITDDSGITLGVDGDITLYNDVNFSYLSSNITDKKLQLAVRSSLTGGYTDALIIDPNESSKITAKFFSTTSSTVKISGDLEVDGAARYSKSIVLSMNITNFVNTNTEIISYLNLVAPITNTPPADKFDLQDGSRARVLCEIISVSTVTSAVTVNQEVREFAVSTGTWQFVGTVV